MYPLLETIRLEEGVFYNMHYHLRRMQYSVRTLLGKDLAFSLYEILLSTKYPKTGLHKCRITYGHDGLDITFHTYSYPQIEHLHIVTADTLEYALKYADRHCLNEIKSQFGKNEEVMILQNGLVTDTSFTNIIYRLRSSWFTPASPLLNGTQRQYLLDIGRIEELDITARDIMQCDELALINAMIDFEHRIRVDIRS